MPRGVQHAEEFARISSMEHNVAIDQTDLFGPSRRYEEKGQTSNPTNAGGINRPTKGKKAAKSRGHGRGNAQARDGGPSRHGSPNKGKVSPARKHHGAGG